MNAVVFGGRDSVYGSVVFQHQICQFPLVFFCQVLKFDLVVLLKGKFDILEVKFLEELG